MIKKIIEKSLEPIIINIADGILNGFFPKDKKNPETRREELLKAFSEDFNFLGFLLKNNEYMELVKEKVKEIEEVINSIPFINASLSDIPKHFTKTNFRKYIKKIAEKNKDIKDLLNDSMIQHWLYINLKELINYLFC
jgi:hypothetical protein